MTGERFIPGMPSVIELEHLHRYSLALNLAKDQCVLDLASGEGYGSNLLSTVAKSVVGVDISPDAVSYSCEKYISHNLSFKIGDCSDLPFESASFDLVVSFETIEHHDRHEEMLAEIARVLKPDGLLFISSPNKLVYSELSGEHNAFHVKELYLEEFDLLLRRFFKNVKIYAQRALPTSVIAPLWPENTAYTQFRMANGYVSPSASIDLPVYYLALVGNSEVIPNLGVSTYENAVQDEKFAYGHMSVSVFETKMFWREVWDAKCDGYSEDRSSAAMYSADALSHVLQLEFPQSCDPVTRLRLDILNAVGGVVLQRMAIIAPDKSTIWQWNGDTAVFQNIVQSVIIPGVVKNSGTCSVLSLGNDPWFELDLSDAVYSKIKPGCALVLEVSPFNLLEKLPEILRELSVYVLPEQGKPLQTPVQFSDNLGSLASLVRHALARRDEVIKDQRDQMCQLREELIRAEAQLDLLKDVILGSSSEDFL